MATRDPLAVRIALLLLPATLLFGGLEAALRLRPEPPPDTFLDPIVVPDDELLWRLRPAADGPLATNELGLRDTAYRADAELKVLVLGDSVTWGDGIDEVTRTFPYLLERRLGARAPGRTVEVIGAGVPGYTSEQEATYLERHGLALAPDAVVVQVSLNDVIVRPPWLARWRGREAVRAAYGFFLRHSRTFAALARAMQRRARAQETARVQALLEPEWPAPVEHAWARMLADLDRMRALAAAREIPVLVLAAPYRSQLRDPRTRRPQERLAEWAAARGVAWVDVLDPLADLPPEAAPRAFRDESHFSELGHDLVADLLVGPVGALVGLPGGPPPRPQDRMRAWALLDAVRTAAAAGDFSRATALLGTAERLAPDLALVPQLQANVAYLQGDRTAAVAALHRGLALEPDGRLFRRNLAALGQAP